LQFNVYEGLFLFDANRFARDHDLPKIVEKWIVDAGGEILVSRLWEERRLAYPIKGHRKGTYWLIYFKTDAQNVKPLNRLCEIDDNVLRQLVLKVHPSLVEPILAHATGETDDEPSEEEPAEEPVAVGAES
jgi:small subunit ribosomal protein S6